MVKEINGEVLIRGSGDDGSINSKIVEFGTDLSENSNTSLRTTIIDGNNDVIDSHVDADGGAHLGTSIIQSIITSSKNYTETNLAAGATFTGEADETFGVNGIQLFHTSDQDCTIYIDQSIDSTFSDSTQTVTDSFTCLANIPCSRTFVSVSPYYRLRVTNNGTSATTKIISATGMTPVINPLPRSLSDDGRLMNESTLTGRQNTDRHVWVTPTNALSVESPVRLVGTNFDGTVKDTNFWSETGTVNGGTVTQAGEIQLDTSTNSAGAAMYSSARKARFVVGSALKFQGLFKFVTAATANNTRRCGAYLSTDGFFFQLVGSTFSIGTRKNSTDTLVNSGSFNGNYGPNFTPKTTQYYKLEIEWTPKGVFYYIDGVLLHKLGLGHYSNLLTLPIKFENVNSGSTTDVAFDCLGAAIMRLGDLMTNPTSYYHAYGSTTGVNLKIGAGTIHTIVFGSAANNAVVTLSDSTTTSTPVLWTYDATGALDQPISVDMGGLPFSDGLRLTVTNSASCTIVYE